MFLLEFILLLYQPDLVVGQLLKFFSAFFFTQREVLCDVANFLCDFFSYSFLNVQFAFSQFEEGERSCSDNELLDIVPAEDLARAYRDSEKKDTPHLLGTYGTDTGRLNLYSVPIHFGPDWLGCFGILTTNKLLRPFLYFLMYFEDCLLDDVLFHVLSRERLEREIDAARAAKTYGVDP